MNNPHAFPAMHIDLADNEHGMTLRDYFAAKAMQAFISAYPCQGIDLEDGGISIDEPSIAYDAYAMADEMLKARIPE